MHWECIHSAQQNQVTLYCWPENDTLPRRPEAAGGGELLPPQRPCTCGPPHLREQGTALSPAHAGQQGQGAQQGTRAWGCGV